MWQEFVAGNIWIYVHYLNFLFCFQVCWNTDQTSWAEMVKVLLVNFCVVSKRANRELHFTHQPFHIWLEALPIIASISILQQPAAKCQPHLSSSAVQLSSFTNRRPPLPSSNQQLHPSLLLPFLCNSVVKVFLVFLQHPYNPRATFLRPFDTNSWLQFTTDISKSLDAKTPNG